jgi:hypothetical protein
MTALTEVATFGWFADEGQDVDLLTSISTFGWYGVTLGELIEYYQTVDFGLIIDQLHGMGLEIEVVQTMGNLPITRNCPLGDFKTTQIFNIRLKR